MEFKYFGELWVGSVVGIAHHPEKLKAEVRILADPPKIRVAECGALLMCRRFFDVSLRQTSINGISSKGRTTGFDLVNISSNLVIPTNSHMGANLRVGNIMTDQALIVSDGATY